MEIKQALASLRKEKKRKFDQTLDLIVNLKNFDLRKEALNTFVSIPHAGKRNFAAFLTKKSKLIDTIIEEDFTKYKETAQMKNLAKKYDAFIASAPMMGKIASHFGRVFGPMNKMPSPQAGIVTQENEESINAMIEKMNKAIRVKNKELSIKIPIGKESMKDSELEENIDAAIKGVEGKLPQGKENIREVLIKFTMTKPAVVIAARGNEQNKVAEKKA